MPRQSKLRPRPSVPDYLLHGNLHGARRRPYTQPVPETSSLWAELRSGRAAAAPRAQRTSVTRS
eukprot:1299756-Pleurochrysis_carterae.AAC.2